MTRNKSDPRAAPPLRTLNPRHDVPPDELDLPELHEEYRFHDERRASELQPPVPCSGYDASDTVSMLWLVHVSRRGLMNILLDTNIAIALDPLAAKDVEGRTPQAVELARLALMHRHSMFVHPASDYDIARDRDSSRRTLRELMIQKYMRLPHPPQLAHEPALALGSPQEESNDWVDNQLVAAVLGDSVDILVTADDGIHRKAARVGIATRVVTIADAVQMLRTLSGREPVQLPQVGLVPAHTIDESDPILESIRTEYGGEDFDDWLRRAKRAQRPVLAIRSSNGGPLQALAILKPNDDEPRLGGHVLKLSTFKVAEEWRGNRFGELLIKAVLGFCRHHGMDGLWVSVFPTHPELLALFEDFGFARTGERMPLGDLVYAKRLHPAPAMPGVELTAFQFHKTFGPPALQLNEHDIFVVPILPQYHRALFPEGEAAPPLIVDAFGNAIRKAYICRSSMRSLSEGSTLLFYRSRDAQAVTAAGVVENTTVSSDAGAIQRFVGNRTVYSATQIEELAVSDVLAILFRHDRMLSEPIELQELKETKALAGPPRTITRVKPGVTEWLKQRIAV